MNTERLSPREISRSSALGAWASCVNWITAEIDHIKDGILAEPWGVLQDEATRKSSKNGLPIVRRQI
jgi:hypothetical protein